MNIAFDASDLCTGRADGTTRYTGELVKRLPGLAKDDSWGFYGPCIAPSPHPNPLPVRGEGIATWHASPFPFAWTQTRFAYELFKNKPDVLFMPIQQLPIFRPRKTKTVAVIHDLAFHEFPQQFRYKDWLLLHTFSAQVANEADAIIAVSQATKDDIKKYYGREHNVYVVHHGIDHTRFKVFSDTEKQDGLQKLQEKYPQIKTPYILFVGQIQPRKNIERLVEAFEKLSADFLPSYEGRRPACRTGRGGGEGDERTPSRLPAGQAGSPLSKGEKYQLVIAGGHGWNNEEIYKRIAQSPARKDIVVTSAVPDELLPVLYANAEVFVLPSLQEGFGIPLIEAAACGVPLVTSNRSSMKEIADGVGVLVDPYNINSIAEGMQEALTHRSEYSAKSVTLAQKFSWDITAQKTLRVLKEVYPEHGRKGVANI